MRFSNPTSAGQFGDRWQLAVAQLVTTTGLVIPCVIIYQSKFQGHIYNHMKWTYEAMTTSLPLYSCLKQVIKNVRENWTTSRCTKKENKCVIVANKIKSTCRAACFLIVLIPMKLPTRSLLFKALPHIPQCHQPAS